MWGGDVGPVITTDLPFQTDYLKWQSSHREFDGCFADPGMGKTRMALRAAQGAWERGEIDAMLVIVPNSIKTSWVAWDHLQEDGDLDEIQKHLGDDNVVKGVWINGATGDTKRAWERFETKCEKTSKPIVLVVNYEALLSEQFYAYLTAFVQEYRTRVVCDESTRIGKAGSQRTKRTTKLGKLAAQRSILTGTPILKSPMKIFSQARFLSESALGYKSFFPFRNRYCVMGGFQNKQITDFKNLDELSAKIDSFSRRYRAEDHLKNMPPRDWKKHYVDMHPAQRAAYQTMRKEFYARVDETEITASIVLAQMTRLQQITGGYLDDLPIIPPTSNPKMLEAKSIIEDYRSIVWFRFKPEMYGLASLLDEANISYWLFHGDMSDAEKLSVRKAYLRGERQVVLGTTATGGIGIDEFKVANTVVFYSNDFDTERREQAEKRTWRIGSDKDIAIRYRDVLIPNTVDTKIIKVLRGDAQLSAQILKERWREWL